VRDVNPATVSISTILKKIIHNSNKIERENPIENTNENFQLNDAAAESQVAK